MYHYAIPTQGYAIYPDYSTSATTSPSSSPSPDAPYGYYTPQTFTTAFVSPKLHKRSPSYTVPAAQVLYSPTPVFASPTPHVIRPDHVSPSAKSKEYVSNKTSSRRYSTSAGRGGGNGTNNVSYTYSGNTSPRRNASMRSQKQNIIVDTSDEAEESPQYTYIKPRTGPKQEKYAKLKANQYFAAHQVPGRDKRDDSPPSKSRSRRASEARPSTARQKSSVPPRREATAADAAKHRIPSGYSLKNWDPTEAPVTLLGSVFDANTIGKWIYDWTVYHHGPAQPMSDVAGDFWLLLIKLAGKMKRAEDCLPRIRDYEDQEEVEEFLAAGDVLWARFKKLVKTCEEFMWKTAKREGKKGPVTMGKNSGCEFIDAIFGRDRKLEETEELMQRIRTWNVRFDKHCEDILRHP